MSEPTPAEHAATRKGLTTADRIAADFSTIPFKDHEARILALAYFTYRREAAALLDALGRAQERAERAEAALRWLLDATDWPAEQDPARRRAAKRQAIRNARDFLASREARDE